MADNNLLGLVADLSKQHLALQVMETVQFLPVRFTSKSSYGKLKLLQDFIRSNRCFLPLLGLVTVTWDHLPPHLERQAV